MEERMIELEKKAAFQENLIQELNTVLLDHQKKIDLLEKRMNALKEQSMRGDLVKPQEYEDRPPHY